MTTFSRLYLRPNEPLSDSPRVRMQLYGFFNELAGGDRADKIFRMLLRMSGVRVYSNYSGIEGFFRSGEFRDILDVVTYTHTVIKEVNGAQAMFWLRSVQSVFDQHNMSYSVDDSGVVHYRVDPIHEAAREAALRHLGKPRYNAVRAEFERTYSALSAKVPDGKNAVRGIFGSLEILFKLMFTAPRLGGAEIRGHLNPILKARYTGDVAAYQAASRMSEELEKWVAAAHYYRHEQGVEEPNPPPPELAVAIVGAGTSHLRWLIDLDAMAA